jgi:signal transduction histidine kinase
MRTGTTKIAADGGRHQHALGGAGLPDLAGLAESARRRLDAAVDRLGTLGRSPASRAAIPLAGAVAAAGVGYLTSVNPGAAPRGAAVAVRVVIICALVAAGVYARTSRIQARMGGLLVAAGLLSALWLLNGSSAAPAFSVALLVTGLIPVVFCSLILAHPNGRVRPLAEQRLLTLAGGGVAVSWAALTVTSRQPWMRTPLLQCGPRCPHNDFFLGLTVPGATPVIGAVCIAAWIGLTVGTAVLATRRTRVAPAPVRRALFPVAVAALAYAVLAAATVALRAVDTGAADAAGAASVAMTAVVPLAILAGLCVERLFMGQALADFVTRLGELPSPDPQTLMADVLRDPSLRIGYCDERGHACVDTAGAPVDTELPGDGRSVTWVRRDGRPVAAIVHDIRLDDQAGFIQAAGAAAVLRLERGRLEAQLKASTADLASSRIRIMETAYAERQRIERDLHDSVQQDLVGLRLKLQMAAEAIREEPARGEKMVASVGRQMDDLLEALRALARGIYPALLERRGLAEALKSAALRAPRPISVDAPRLGRYPQDVEIAVYFCCLEALQNVVKHAGPAAKARIRLRERPGQLRFEVTDNGVGFGPEAVQDPHGTLNMRDRIEAVGGVLTIGSCPGRGTTVKGTVPIR